MTGRTQDPVPGEVYFEFTQVGRSMKVAAIDAHTGVEVSIVGPAACPQSQLENLALKKLRKRLEVINSGN